MFKDAFKDIWNTMKKNAKEMPVSEWVVLIAVLIIAAIGLEGWIERQGIKEGESFAQHFGYINSLIVVVSVGMAPHWFKRKGK